MPILVCGINHKTAPVAVREQVIFPQEKLTFYLQDLILNENLTDAVILSTCNRSDLYCVTDDAQKVLDWFYRQHAVPRAMLESVMYVYQDQAAVEHIMNVACGLDSMVLGESQILGQMKTAFSESCAAGAAGPLFNRLFQQVFAVAKEVRTNTSIGACPVSVSSAAVNFIQAHFAETLTQAKVLIIGAGVTVELLLRHFKNALPKQLLIANRSVANAQALAEQYAVKVTDFEKLPATLSEVDIVISATGSVLPIVTYDMVAHVQKPLFMLDIAVPRDIEARVAECAQVRLHSIDDLKESIQRNLRGREHAAEKAHEMIKQKSQDFIAWLDAFDKVSATIRVYRKQIEDLCHAELAKATKQLNRGDDPTQVLASFAHAFTNKLLHTPSVQLRQAGFAGRMEVLQLAQELFAIPVTD